MHVVSRCDRDSPAETVGELLKTIQRGAEPALLSPDGSERGIGTVFHQWPRSCRRLSLPTDPSRHFKPLLLHPPTKDTRHH